VYGRVMYVRITRLVSLPYYTSEERWIARGAFDAGRHRTQDLFSRL